MYAMCSTESNGMYFGVCKQAERECWSDHMFGVTPRDAKRWQQQPEERQKSLGTASWSVYVEKRSTVGVVHACAMLKKVAICNLFWCE